MNIIKTFERAFDRAKKQNWDYIVVLVDIHDTIFKATWDAPENYEWLGKAKETLQLMTKMPNIKMILWSSSYISRLVNYIDEFTKNDICFDAINENIEGTTNTKIACFDEKPYFSVGIDNAFGFDPENDWEDIYNYLITKNI